MWMFEITGDSLHFRRRWPRDLTSIFFIASEQLFSEHVGVQTLHQWLADVCCNEKDICNICVLCEVTKDFEKCSLNVNGTASNADLPNVFDWFK